MAARRTSGGTLAKFPISRDPPEGGTGSWSDEVLAILQEEFPISRDPPEGGTFLWMRQT